ncbi:MAG: hypothetical protein ABIE47_07110 [Pseudomonadota bacterium]
MAWTEQCKVAFCNTAEGLYIKNGNKGIVKIIKKISRESDIPFNTLRNWYYQEKKITENGNPPQSGKKRKPSQESAWKNVARRMESLNKYMTENCDPEVEISEETREAVFRQAEHISLWRQSLSYRTNSIKVRYGKSRVKKEWKKGMWQEP